MNQYNLCKVCNNKIYYSNGDEKRKLFCSKKCKTYYYNRNMKGKKNYCLDCNKQISLKSKRCRECAIKKRDFNAEKNPRWEGGTSEGYQIKIYSNILKQNGINLDICQKCNKTREEVKRIHIHHINNDHNDNRLSNLIVLCAKCHLNIHNYYRIKVECSYCGKEKLVTKCKYETTKNHFCNRDCFSKYMQTSMIGNTHVKKNGEVFKCKNCSKEFYLSPSKINKSKYKFCSHMCFYEYRRNDKEAMKLWNKKMLEAKKNKNNK